jgi:hypothetical protein
VRWTARERLTQPRQYAAKGITVGFGLGRGYAARMYIAEPSRGKLKKQRNAAQALAFA